MRCTTFRTGPRPVAETQMLIDILTYVTSLGTRIVSVHFPNLATVLRSDMLQLQHERSEGEVGYLPAPEFTHARQLEVFDADSIIAST